MAMMMETTMAEMTSGLISNLRRNLQNWNDPYAD